MAPFSSGTSPAASLRRYRERCCRSSSASAANGRRGDMLEKLFRLDENRTTVRIEILAGLTTYLTMAYIVFVNPMILSGAGMDRGAVFVATCLASAFATLLM